jgi:hypothetical protein
MNLKNIIRRVLTEQEEVWVDIDPEDYIDLLKYVNGDGGLIKKLPQYRGKKIRITGSLFLHKNGNVSNIDSVDYVDGDLNIDQTKIPYFDKNKVKGKFSYWYSEMHNIERRKILNQKLETLDQYRQNGEWDITNNDEESNETEALYRHLSSEGIIGVYENNEGEEIEEDKYFINKTKYKYYGDTSMYEWLGDNDFESEWIVINDDDIEYAATEALKQRIEEIGYDAFSEWVWEDNLDHREVEDWLYNFYEDSVRDDPEGYGIEKDLTSEQERYVEIYEEKINRLTKKLNPENITEEEYDEIEAEIIDIENLIQEIKENPEGDFNEDLIEDAIQAQVDDSANDFPRFLKDMGFESKYILEFVDIDGVCKDIIRHDGYGEILNSYNGDDDEYEVNGQTYHVMRNS